MRLSILSLLCAGIVAFPALADVPAWTMDKAKSSLKFIAIQNGASVEGTFTDFTADIRFDPNQLDKSAIKVDVNMASLRTANDDVQTNLKTPDWLSIEAFPKAGFTCCSKLTRMPMSDNFYGDGKLNLRGKAVPVVLNFRMEHYDGHHAIATGFVTLHREDFGIGQGQWAKDDVIKKEVRVEFRVVADR